MKGSRSLSSVLGSSSEDVHNETHEKIYYYIEQHNLNELVTDMMNTVLHDLPSDPISFMVLKNKINFTIVEDIFQLNFFFIY